MSDPLRDLVAVMDRLRSSGGCPWDAEQTHETLVTYLLEEAYELAEAIENGDRAAMREELGDVLLQVVFHSRIAREHPTDPWSIDDVAAGITAKLISRHPHVFGDAHAPDAAAVESAWLARKQAEKARDSVLDGIPAGLPALLLAAKVLHRARVGGLTEQPSSPEILDAASAAMRAVGPEHVGDLVLASVEAAQTASVDADSQLRASVRDFAARVRLAERSGVPDSRSRQQEPDTSNR
jgi:XTP/dITP diphosphohydrolase